MQKHLWIWILAILILPASVAADDWDDDWEDDDEGIPVEIHGFLEGAMGTRVVSDPNMPMDFLLGESRFRLDMSHYSDRSEFSFKGDFIHDTVTEETLIDIRRAWVSLQATPWLDARIGRQVLTWGTGDLVFLNDLFPKDFQSFFLGRDDEFLKAPANSVKLSAYSSTLNADMVWTPIFEPDRFITGERLSYYSPAAGSLVGADSTFTATAPEALFKNGEFAARLFRNLGSYEWAAYGYWGFSKQPQAYDTGLMSPTFSRLAAMGSSLRGNVLGGLFNLEGAYYISRDDRDGKDPLIPNSEIRGLAGLEQEIATNLTLGLQYYLEWVQQYEELRQSSPDTGIQELRDMATMRLTWRTMQETLVLSLFGFVALGDGDTHWRPSITRQINDATQITLGGNIMTGPKDTFFGQLQDNTNAYLRVRYSF